MDRHDRLGTLAALSAISSPVLILHSREDEIVPVFMAEKNYDAARAPKRLVELLGDHHEGYIDSGKIYTVAVAGFLRELAEEKP